MTKIVFTGDVHCAFETLDLVEKVFTQIYAIKLDALVLLGDLKQVYNPLDIRVLNFILYWIDRFQKAGVKVFILLGNHDRVGMTSDEESWLSALAYSGAFVASKPSYFALGNVRLFFLPYRSSVKATKEAAKKLVDHSYRQKGFTNVLCFHNGLQEAKYNAFVDAKDEKLSVEDLFPKKYTYVLGAHLHMHQKVKYEHVMYVGSPFATDWGEANQKKGFLYLEV